VRNEKEKRKTMAKENVYRDDTRKTIKLMSRAHYTWVCFTILLSRRNVRRTRNNNKKKPDVGNMKVLYCALNHQQKAKKTKTHSDNEEDGDNDDGEKDMIFEVYILVVLFKPHTKICHQDRVAELVCSNLAFMLCRRLFISIFIVFSEQVSFFLLLSCVYGFFF
jgi:hypothetical protein